MNLTTFVYDSTNYFGHGGPLIVKAVTQNNYSKLEDYMNANKLKINGGKSHLMVKTKGDRVARGEKSGDNPECGGQDHKGVGAAETSGKNDPPDWILETVHKGWEKGQL